MSYVIPALTCQLFISGAPEVFESFGTLDIRLGLEQIQDTPEFRENATRRWEMATAGEDFPIDPSTVYRFREVSPRHLTLTEVDIMLGLMKIIDNEYFIDSCQQRWRRFDQQPWQVEDTNFQNGFDISAMPEGEMTA